MLNPCLSLVIAGLLAMATLPPVAADPLCGPIRVGVRTDAPPFSYRIAGSLDGDRVAALPHCGVSASGILPRHAGYTVELCRRWLGDLRRRCSDHGGLQITPVEIAVGDRHRHLADGTGFDVLCGATTATVTLSALRPRTPYTFLTSASVLVNENLVAGRSCRIGVVRGTSSDPDRQDAVEYPRRVEAWTRFALDHPQCDVGALDGGSVVPFDTTAEAILALTVPPAPEAAGDTAAEPPDDLPMAEGLPDFLPSRIDALIDDDHILRWYVEALHNGRLAQMLDLRPPGMSEAAAWAACAPAPETGEISAYCRLDGLAPTPPEGIADLLQIFPAAISVEPYAVFGTPDAAERIADFSRFLTRHQRDAGKVYSDLLRGCFERRIDRSFWFLMEFQSKVRDGNPLGP